MSDWVKSQNAHSKAVSIDWKWRHCISIPLHFEETLAQRNVKDTAMQICHSENKGLIVEVSCYNVKALSLWLEGFLMKARLLMQDCIHSYKENGYSTAGIKLGTRWENKLSHKK